jgi:hypothetical protein
MTDDDFEKLLSEFLGTENPEMATVEFDFNEGHGDSFGADHALIKHGVTKDDIGQVLFELEAPEEKRSKDDPARTIFWGHTRTGDAICVVCIDGTTDGRRQLGLITAFRETEPEWRRRQ